MKKLIFTTIALISLITISKAQTTAMQFTGVDCNNNPVDLFGDLDSGKAVLLHYYMPNCGSCPPPAQKIQAMADHIMQTYPGMVKGYAFPYQNSTDCSSSSSWVTSSNLTLYAPMDSGATQVAYYGGFGMPTVVLLGGTNHRVMFVTQSFSTSDTTIMRDSILTLFNPTMGLENKNKFVSSVNIFPNPASDEVQVEMNIKATSNLKMEVMNLFGEIVSTLDESNSVSGLLKKQISTANYSSGIYFIRISANDKIQNYKFAVSH